MKTRLLFCLILFYAGFAKAATTYTWAGGSSGNWTTASNWSPSTGYPGSSGTTDIAVINTSSATITLGATITIATLKTTSYGISGITISVSSGYTLNIGSGMTTAQPSSASNVFTFAGLGITRISGTVSAGYSASYAISANATVYLNASAVFDESTSNPHGSLNNAGTLNVLSGATLKFGDQASLVNSGTIHSYSASYTFSGSGSPACTINNTGTIIDHGSTMSFTGQNAAFLNNSATNVCLLHGTTITASTGNNGMSITNAGTFTADSTSVITLGTQSMVLSNSGTFYAGTSNSKCTITLSGQGSYISNTGTFYEASTSVIAPSGISANITTSGTFTLLSDAYGSATISQLSSTASCTGTFKVQRYLQGGSGYRSYRLLSSQVYSATVSTVNVYSINYLQNSIYLTGTTLAAGGFDVNTSPATTHENPTLYFYRENVTNPQFSTFLNSNFIGVSKINNSPSYGYSMNDATYTSTYNIPAGSGYLCFFRGDRSTTFANKTTAPFPAPENTTLVTSGTLNTGTITARNWFNPGVTTLSYTSATNANYRGFNLVGNPYPSSIDWETYSNTSGSGIYVKNISKTIYELNPLTQNYDIYQKGGAYTNHGSRYIASGQAFFVLDTLAGGFVVFNESAKSNNLNTGLNLFMGIPDEQTLNSQYLRLQLAKDSIYTDDIMLRFVAGASSRFNYNMDALYRPGQGVVSLSSLSGDNFTLAINTRSLPKTADTIHLVVSASADGVYKLNMQQIVGIPELFDIWLKDKYTNDSLDMRHNPSYSFNLHRGDAASYGADRFSIVIRQNPAYTYRLLSFTAAKQVSSLSLAKHVQLTWTTENEADYTYFTAERSTDNGQSYQVAGSVAASGLGSYGLTDVNPSASNLYRLKSVDINGAVTYSKIVPVMYQDQSGSAKKVSVYPNPVSSTLNISVAAENNPDDTYSIMITNSSGLVVKQVTSSQANWQANAADLLPGTYVVKVFSNKKQTEVGNAKFIKL